MEQSRKQWRLSRQEQYQNSLDKSTSNKTESSPSSTQSQSGLQMKGNLSSRLPTEKSKTATYFSYLHIPAPSEEKGNSPKLNSKTPDSRRRRSYESCAAITENDKDLAEAVEVADFVTESLADISEKEPRLKYTMKSPVETKISRVKQKKIHGIGHLVYDPTPFPSDTGFNFPVNDD